MLPRPTKTTEDGRWWWWWGDGDDDEDDEDDEDDDEGGDDAAAAAAAEKECQRASEGGRLGRGVAHSHAQRRKAAAAPCARGGIVSETDVGSVSFSSSFLSSSFDVARRSIRALECRKGVEAGTTAWSCSADTMRRRNEEAPSRHDSSFQSPLRPLVPPSTPTPPTARDHPKPHHHSAPSLTTTQATHTAAPALSSLSLNARAHSIRHE
jgi:hypothetical protein